MPEPDDKVALCVASFYADLAEKLEAGARQALASAGYGEDQIQRFEVPGAFELPLIARYAAESGRFVAVVALGAVIRGESTSAPRPPRASSRSSCSPAPRSASGW
jgi:6,7-dimethyl-8-ribityllumazine synthase